MKQIHELEAEMHSTHEKEHKLRTALNTHRQRSKEEEHLQYQMLFGLMMYSENLKRYIEILKEKEQRREQDEK